MCIYTYTHIHKHTYGEREIEGRKEGREKATIVNIDKKRERNI